MSTPALRTRSNCSSVNGSLPAEARWEAALGTVIQVDLPDGKIKVRIYADVVARDEPVMVRKLRIGQLHGGGLRALVYTVNDAAVARRLAGLGIDGIITDAVDRFSPGSSVHD